MTVSAGEASVSGELFNEANFCGSELFKDDSTGELFKVLDDEVGEIC